MNHHEPFISDFIVDRCRQVSTLLANGQTRTQVARQLHLTGAQMNHVLRTIRAHPVATAQLSPIESSPDGVAALKSELGSEILLRQQLMDRLDAGIKELSAHDHRIRELYAAIRKASVKTLKKRGRKFMSDEERAQVSKRMHKYWSTRSPAQRAQFSERARKRWAAKRRAAGAKR